MPKQPGGVSKFQRVEALKSVLARWGRLNKSQIDERVASALDCSSESLERSLYRDLEDLEAINEVVVLRYGADGQLLEDYNPEIHRNITCEWALKEFETAVLGGGILKDSNISFLAAPRLTRAFQVNLLSTQAPADSIHLIFQPDQRSYRLSLAKDALPAKIMIGRVQERKQAQESHQFIQEVFGKRSCCLLVPFPSVSKIKKEDQLGHVLFEFAEPGHVLVHDMKSKNGIQIFKLTHEQANAHISALSTRKELTHTDGFGPFGLGSDLNVSQEKIQAEPLTSGQILRVKIPVLIQVSRAFHILLTG